MAKRHWRTQPRDPHGRWASAGGLAGAAAGAAVGGALGSRAARRRLVPGSVRAESHLGTTRDGKWTGAKVGARYHAPGGRQVVVKAIVGVSRAPQPPKPQPRTNTRTQAARAAQGTPGRKATPSQRLRR